MLSLFTGGEPLSPGTLAPDFTLRDDAGNLVTLSSLRGHNVVLVFYPADQTPVCTKQLCEFRDESALASARDALVFGVNPGSAASHTRFRERYRLPFPLLVDEGSHIARLYHAKAPLWIVRTVYVIAKDGRVLYAGRGKPNPAEVLAAVS